MSVQGLYGQREEAELVVLCSDCSFEHGAAKVRRLSSGFLPFPRSHCSCFGKGSLNGPGQLHGHCVAWLRCEGQLRVLASLQDPERLRLKRVLLGKRSDAYRRMCAEPVDTKLQYKAATREVSSP